ncbi:MAG: glycoside hydrolase family 92 protein, partial [Coprobacter sp.]|nr:glycoside hydrolase family 92 protein [Coprobacter sp.]
MRRAITIFLLLFALSFVNKAESLVDYVNPLMGTESTFSFSHGNTYPAVALPWGVNFWSPQTGENRNGWMYAYSDTVIRGFKQTHQPSPWINDYAVLSVMPLSGELKINHKERGVGFSHQNEEAHPYLYSVMMDNGVRVSLTPTRTSSVIEVEYPSLEGQYFVIDAQHGGSKVEIDQMRRRVTGYVKNHNGGVPANFTNYYVMEFSHPIAEKGVMINDSLFAGRSVGEHDRVCGYLRFIVPEGEKLTVKISSSFISADQAQLNFNREVRGKTFEEVKGAAISEWNSMLGRAVVEDDDRVAKQTFYSCLYRVLLFPREFYEYDSEGNPCYYSPY